MLKAGYYICPKCGRIDCRAFYKSAAKKGGVFLKHRRGLRGSSFVAEMDQEAEKSYQTAELLPAADTGTGCPGTIRVRFDHEDRATEMLRVCPNCKSAPYQLPDCYGRYPTIVLAMVGGTGAGKSTWLDSISHVDNIRKLTRAHLVYQLDFPNAHGDPEAELKPTSPGELGSTTYLTLHTGKAGKDTVLAGVLMIDTAGETYKRNKEQNFSVLSQICQEKYGKYTGIDGFMVFDSLIQGGNVGDCTEVYQFLRKRNLLSSRPVAFVRTNLDKFLRRSDIPNVRCTDDKTELPLLDRSTFLNGSSYRVPELHSRFQLENYISWQFPSDVFGVLADFNRSCRGFLVQSCASSKADPTPKENQTTNLYDPLLWLLNTLGLFPLRSHPE